MGKTVILLAGEVRTKGDGAPHDEPPMLINMNYVNAALGNPLRESGDRGTGVMRQVPDGLGLPLIPVQRI